MDGKSDILLVGHSLADVARLTQLLKKYPERKFNLIQVEKIEAAIELLAQANFDLILLDLSNSNDRILNACQAIEQKAPQIPIIVLTDNKCLNFGIDVLHQGAQDCLVKAELTAHSLYRSIQYAIVRQKTEFKNRQSALMKQMLDRIRSSIDLEAILQKTATIIQQFLNSDRVLIYRCESEQSTREQIQQIRSSPPSRRVQSRRGNVSGRYQASKNGGDYSI